MQDWKMTDKVAEVENAGLENDGHGIKGELTPVHVHHGPCTFTCNSIENSELLITLYIPNCQAKNLFR